jgi:hypothetical protein
MHGLGDGLGREGRNVDGWAWLRAKDGKKGRCVALSGSGRGVSGVVSAALVLVRTSSTWHGLLDVLLY